MSPHCDSMDGPVVKAAVRALEANDVDLVLPFVKEDGEEEVRQAFAEAVRARKVAEARKVSDLYFFDTVVRVHQTGEGAEYTGLKPAGPDVGDAIPAAERAIEEDSAHELTAVLSGAVADEVTRRLGEVRALQRHADGSVARAREYVEAMLALQTWAHEVYLVAKGRASASHDGELSGHHQATHRVAGGPPPGSSKAVRNPSGEESGPGQAAA